MVQGRGLWTFTTVFKLLNDELQEERGHFLGQSFLKKAQEVKSQGTSVTSRYVN